MRYRLKDQTGSIVNIVELEAGANWNPPTGYTVEVVKRTDKIDEIVRPPQTISKQMIKLKSKLGVITEFEVVP